MVLACAVEVVPPFKSANHLAYIVADPAAIFHQQECTKMSKRTLEMVWGYFSA